ncbi:unnamed protein product [Brassica oleracea var. botrytis]|uniref:(rape) hypothetical protein n=1 Tax=Brassica napus TaxID=3708 RepID=A0A816RPP9_BRANA|nr:unnamed protein product [Brassica napus]
MTEQAQRTEHGDLRTRISNKRDIPAKNVWNRLDRSYNGFIPRDRERYHPYSRDTREEARNKYRDSANPTIRGRYGDSVSSSSWRVKGSSPPNQNRVQEQYNERRKTDHSSRSNKNSPDSQRTISEIYRHSRNEVARRRHERSPQVTRMEWQPVRVSERRKEGQQQQLSESEPERELASETEEERRCRIKGKAVDESSNDIGANPVPIRIASGTFRIREPAANKITER